MDLQEDIAAKVEIIKADIAKELDLLPQGENVPRDAQAFKDELERITKYVLDLQKKVQEECDKYSEDVKFWAEYKTGIKEFTPWLGASEAATGEGLTKPTNLDESKALHSKVHSFDKACLDHLKLLEAANAASQKMTTHETADTEVAALRERYGKVKAVSDEWVKKVDVLLKEWTLLDNTVTELNSWLPRTSPLRARTSSLWRRWNPPLESSRTSSRRRRSWSRVCNLRPSKIQFNQIGIQSNRSECCLRPNNLNLSTIPLVPLNIYVAQFA